MKSLAIMGAIGAAALLGACQTAGMDDDMSADGMAATSASASADVVQVGGADMFANRTIVQNAVNSPIHRTLVSAVQAAGLVDTLNGPGPFTVFAPDDPSFQAVPAATLQSLLQPANRAQLQSVLTYHVVPGNVTAADIAAAIRAGGGTATFTTVQGGQLRASMSGDNVVLTGGNGSRATVTQADVRQSNGVIHVVRGVLLPG